MMGATIANVAAAAGVGVGTVSRVLNGSPSVGAATRQRVLDVIAALDYQPSAAARALSTGRTHTIGVVAPFFTTPSVIERLRGVSRTLAGASYQLVLFDVEHAEQPGECFRSEALRGLIDGMLSISLAPSDQEARRLQAAGVPVVLVDRAHESLPTVTIDDVAGGRMAAEHLLALGHRRIAFLGDEEENRFGFDSSARRREGFAAALAAAGAPLDTELVVRVPHGRDVARDAAGALLALSKPPTAIFAGSDAQAIGVLDAAQAAGVPVPGRLSVIGFDNVEAAEYTGLTTIAQPLEASGALGAELLLRALAGEKVEDRRLPLEVVVRASTAPFRRRSREGNGRHALRSEVRRRRVHR